MDEHEPDKNAVDAWNQYLCQTREAAGSVRYGEVEPWAWACLQARLGKLKPQRSRRKEPVSG